MSWHPGTPGDSSSTRSCQYLEVADLATDALLCRFSASPYFSRALECSNGKTHYFAPFECGRGHFSSASLACDGRNPQRGSVGKDSTQALGLPRSSRKILLQCVEHLGRDFFNTTPMPAAAFLSIFTTDASPCCKLNMAVQLVVICRTLNLFLALIIGRSISLLCAS